MAVWDVVRFESDALVVSDGQQQVHCQVKDAKIVWNKENKALPKYIKERIRLMASTRKYVTCEKNSCVHHNFSARDGVTNVCGLRKVMDHVTSGEIQADMGFWYGLRVNACSKFEHIISRM